jgi:hypothetical protein
MMKYFIVVCLLTILNFGVENTSTCIKGPTFKGYIFHKNNTAFLSIPDQKEKFTPSDHEIRLLEKSLLSNIDSLNRDKVNQGRNCPVINKNLKKYVRQYFGFINNKGEKIIFINFVWSKFDSSLIEKLGNEYVEINDGCSRFWSIRYNFSQDRFFDLMVNTSS